ncbi:MAG: homoaconitate hydratase family protein [Candidatus Omnitrophica bacterium]|nr:homoaconitate hydratase family protein [Candidatus Omnitrophota bacterium]
MGYTIIEKILREHSASKELGDFIYVSVDFCFGNDITAPLAVKGFLDAGFDAVADPRKIGFICDHFVPARDAKAANNVMMLKAFAERFHLPHFYDIHQCGIEHVFLVERGLVQPGKLVIGADSHTCTYGGIGAASFGVGSTDLLAAMKEGKCWLKAPQTIKFVYKGTPGEWIGGKDLILHTIGKIGVDGALYKVMEFTGPVISRLGVEDRLTMCNMAIEAGGKTGVVPPDERTFAYLRRIQGERFQYTPEMADLKSDDDARYADVQEIDVSGMPPQVACPHLPSNVRPVDALDSVRVDQVVIGSCTNGRISDLRIAASVLQGRKIKPEVRVVILPGSHSVYAQAEREGLLKSFVDAGCIVSPPTCGSCLGGHAGILDKGEVALATTNRNFIGRMGDPESFVYLSGPAVAAASALTGKITHPERIM